MIMYMDIHDLLVALCMCNNVLSIYTGTLIKVILPFIQYYYKRTCYSIINIHVHKTF